jgi:hypothetical protein
MEKAKTFPKPNPSILSRYLLKKAGVLLPEIGLEYYQAPTQQQITKIPLTSLSD